MRMIVSLQTQRWISVVAGTMIAVASGTCYAYSAWAPQFAERLSFSSKEINLIGAAGNIGLYAAGVPVGLLTDTKGPRISMLLGATLMGLGYFPIYLAYVGGKGSVGFVTILVAYCLTGLGSSAAFSAAIKAAASNFPDTRGTATAFPMAGFGLSAFFFSSMASMAFRGNTAGFLLTLCLGTSVMVLFASFFLRVIPPSPSYAAVPQREVGSSGLPAHGYGHEEPGTQHIERVYPYTGSGSYAVTSTSGAVEPRSGDVDETSSLVSKDLGPRVSEERASVESSQDPVIEGEVGSHCPDIRGLALIKSVDFWHLFLLMGLLSGIGLMTINNIGNTTRALWKYYDDSVSRTFVQDQQVMHVSMLSICSFLGRISSGIGSDILVHKLSMSRFWCVLLSAVVFTVTQLAATSISNPNHLFVVSSLTGLAYGFLFGCYPSVVAHTFGISGISQNWGAMTLSPVISGNIFNLIYGAIYDQHSVVVGDGPGSDNGHHNAHRDCREGLGCYRDAFWMTFCAGLAGIVVCWVCLWREKKNARYDPSRIRRKSEELRERLA